MNIIYKYIKVMAGAMVALLATGMYGTEKSPTSDAQLELNRAFLKTCQAGNLDDVQRYLAAGADLEFNEDGTALGWAVYNKQQDVISFLLSKKADVNAELSALEESMKAEEDLKLAAAAKT